MGERRSKLNLDYGVLVVLTWMIFDFLKQESRYNCRDYSRHLLMRRSNMNVSNDRIVQNYEIWANFD